MGHPRLADEQLPLPTRPAHLGHEQQSALLAGRSHSETVRLLCHATLYPIDLPAPPLAVLSSQEGTPLSGL